MERPIQPDQIRGASGGGWEIFRARVKVSNVHTFSKKGVGGLLTVV